MVLPRQSGSLATELDVLLRSQQLAQVDLLAMLVRQLDADGVAAGDDGDAGGHRAHRARDVVGQADHARRLDAGRRLELVQRDDRAGPRIGDLAAHAEILQHGLERLGILLQHVVAERLAFGRLRWRGQHRHRRQHEAAGGLLRRRARCAFARGGLVLVFLLFVVFLVLLLVDAFRHDRGAGPAEVRLAAVEGHRARRGAARDQPAVEAREEAADARAHAEHGVRDQAERHHEAGFTLGRLVLLASSSTSSSKSSSTAFSREPAPLAITKVTTVATPKTSAESEAGEEAVRAEQRGRQPQQGIAGDAAEPGRQRPCAAARQAAGEAGAQHGGENPEGDAQRFAVEVTVRQHPPAPDRHRQQQHDRAEAECLHQQVGGDRAGIAEHDCGRVLRWRG